MFSTDWLSFQANGKIKMNKDVVTTLKNMNSSVITNQAENDFRFISCSIKEVFSKEYSFSVFSVNYFILFLRRWRSINQIRMQCHQGVERISVEYWDSRKSLLFSGFHLYLWLSVPQLILIIESGTLFEHTKEIDNVHSEQLRYCMIFKFFDYKYIAINKDQKLKFWENVMSKNSSTTY